MSIVEKKVLDFLIKNERVLFCGIITILAFSVRFSARKFESADYEVCLKGWYYYFCDNHGLPGLREQIGNYPIIYQFFIALMTYIPINELYLYKFISIIFDYVLAVVGGMLINVLTNEKNVFTRNFCAIYTVILFLPTVFMNSAVWAQCDSIYTAFIFLFLFCLFCQKYNLSFVFLGIAFAFKIQTVFIIPFVLTYYIVTKKFSITKLLISLFSFWIMSLPGFIYGRSFMAPFQWAFQLTDGGSMQCGMPNIWNIIVGEYQFFSIYAIILTIVILGLGLFYILENQLDLNNKELLLLYLAWSIWTCVIFLPGMHERYSYMLCIVLLICVIYTKCKGIFLCFFVEQICIISTYMQFLYSDGLNIKYVSLVYIGVYFYFSMIIHKKSRNELLNNS